MIMEDLWPGTTQNYEKASRLTVGLYTVIIHVQCPRTPNIARAYMAEGTTEDGIKEPIGKLSWLIHCKLYRSYKGRMRLVRESEM